MIYDLGLCLALLGIFLKKRKLPPNLFGGKLPSTIDGSFVIWIHAVSLGETKAASSLIPHIKETYPDSTLIVTSITSTGHEAAKSCIPEADHYFFLPLDISWIMRRFVRAIKPDLLLIVDGDYWYNMLRAVKKLGGKIAVINGKMSERSKNRYSYFKRIFAPVDLFCLQNDLYFSRYQTLNIPQAKLHVTGNIKFDIPKPHLKPFTLKGEFITLASTHEGEEKLILDILLPILPKNITVLVAPRHPHRFSSVKKLLKDYPQAHLIDQMGELPTLYAHSKLAIVGGSFNQDVGGHDIFEPIRFSCPVIFGPYMHKQLELKELVTKAGVGFEANLTTLPAIFMETLKSSFSGETKALQKSVQGTSKRTWENIRLHLNL